MNNDLNAIFSQNGLLSNQISNYQPRNAQLQMAHKVSEVIQKQGVLLCEAGTGTGKTFAYLIPAILSGKPVIISTGTKNLQDQLFYKDLPIIASALESLTQRQLNTSLLKGRSNYVCLYRFKKALDEAWYNEQTQADLQIIKANLKQTKFADSAEFKMLKERSPAWSVITSTSDNCLGSACPDHDDCYVLKAREQANSADIIIVNHHLLMADLRLKSDALGELLPSAETYIIDEAHQLPDIASRFFARHISSGQIKDLLKDVRRFLSKAPVPIKQFMAVNEEVRKMLDDLLMVLKRYKQRGSWSEVREAIKPLCDEVRYLLGKLKRLLEPMAPGSAELENCYIRSEQLLNDFDELTGRTPDAMIHWFECRNSGSRNSGSRNQGFEIHLTPLSVGEAFQRQLDATSSSWIFTSATLTVNSLERVNSHESFNDYERINSATSTDTEHQLERLENHSLFAYFAAQLALKQVDSLQLDSPFNYNQQAILFAPQNLPLPNDVNYIPSLIRAISPIIEWLEGKTFFLFTSYRAMQEARDILSDMDFHLYVQGDAPKQQLINEFKVATRAVLLGTSSFWEGVDVKGDALSCVLIDKLPFASPYDPVIQARINHIQQQGKNAFYQYQLPQAAMSLKQGSGRLIRDVNDKGILIIADPRLYHKSYGYYLRKCLPDMPVVSDFEQLKLKFEQIKEDMNSHPYFDSK